MNYFRFIVAIHSLVAMSAIANPPTTEGIVEVLRGSSGDATMGFVADAHGHVIAPVDEYATKLKVRSGGTEYDANRIGFDDSSCLALLKISSPTPKLVPYPFAKDPVEKERIVYGAKKDNASKEIKIVLGSVSEIKVSDNANVKGSWIIHNASVEEYGSPLFNNCGEVVGVIADSSCPYFWLSGSHDEAVSADWVVRNFSPEGLKPKPSSESCLSVDKQKQRAEEEADEAAAKLDEKQKVADKAQKELEQLKADGKAKQEEIENAKKKAAEAQKVATEAKEAQEVADKKLDEKQKVVDEQQKIIDAQNEQQSQYEFWALIIGVIFALVLLLTWLMYRRSATKARFREALAKQREEEAQEALAVQEAREEEINQLPNVLLSGEDANSRRFVLRVTRESLMEGAIVGRSPKRSDHMLNHEEMSRQHFRLFARHGTIVIEDLGSTNGTEVNGIMLASGGEAVLLEGAQVKIGNLILVVHLEQD